VWKSVGSFPKVSDRGWKKTYKIKLVSVFIRSLLKLCRFCCMISETTYVIPPFERCNRSSPENMFCFYFDNKNSRGRFKWNVGHFVFIIFLDVHSSIHLSCGFYCDAGRNRAFIIMDGIIFIGLLFFRPSGPTRKKVIFPMPRVERVPSSVLFSSLIFPDA
jgi:hypothetical protein